MKRVALKDLDLAAYEVKTAHQLVSKWERVIERADEYERLVESERWHDDDTNAKIADRISDAELFIENLIEWQLQSSEACRVAEVGVRSRCPIAELFALKLILPYDGFSLMNCYYYGSIDENDYEDPEDGMINAPVLPEVSPEDFKRFSTVASALEIKTDPKFLELINELMNDVLFRMKNNLRLKEYEMRGALVEKLVRLFRISAARAKSIGRPDIAERLVEAAYHAGRLQLCDDLRDNDRQGIAYVERALVDDINALARAVAVYNLPSWEEVVSNAGE